MEANGRLTSYELDAGRRYHYLRILPVDSSNTNGSGVRENPKGNVEKFQELEQHLLDLGFQENQLETLYCLIAAILNLGEIQFKQEQDKEVEIENPEAAAKGEDLFLKSMHTVNVGVCERVCVSVHSNMVISQPSQKTLKSVTHIWYLLKITRNFNLD